VDRVLADRITVAFDASLDQTPHPTAPGFRIGLPLVSDVELDGAFKRFTVWVPASNPLQAGVKAGNPVFYRDALGTPVQGEIEESFVGGFTVRFAAALEQDPHPSAPSFEIVRPGTLLNQLTAFLGPLSDPEKLSVEVPTLQELLRRLALHLGLDEIEGVQLTG